MPRELGRYTGNTIAEQIGVVRLQDDATAATRALIQGTGALAEKASETARLAEQQYLDDFNIAQREKYTELTKQHQLDPEAFKAAWKGHTEGTLKNVPWAFRNSAGTVLGDLGSRGYANVVEFQNANQRRNSHSSWQTNLTQLGELYLAAVRRKDTKEIERTQMQYGLALENGQRLQFIDEQGVQQERDRLSSLGAAALAADEIEAAWRKGGMPAARKAMHKFETDPAFAAARDRPTTFAALKSEAWSKVRELEADAARGRAAALDGLDMHVKRAAEGLPLDYDALRKYEKVAGPNTRAGKIISTLIDKAPVIETFRSASLQDQASELASLERQIEDPKNPNIESLTLQREVLRAINTRARAAYKQDSFNYANKVHVQQEVADIDFTKPDLAELAKRREIVGTAEPRLGEPVMPFSSEEMARFAGTWNTAAPADKGQIASQLYAGLGPQLANRVLGKLSKDGNVDRAAVYAAGIGAQNPALARDIYAGLEVLRTEKNAAKFKDEDTQRAFNEYTGLAYKNSPEARDGAYESSRALMALWAKNNGKVGEEIPPDEQRKVIERVVGPTVRHNGATLLPPSRETDQRAFDTMLSRIRDQDAPKLKAADGSEVSITKALRAGVLENVGDGRYVIRFGENYYLPDPANPRRPFVIDRSFFEGVDARTAAEDLGAFTGGEPVPIRNRRITKAPPLGVPTDTTGAFGQPKGGITGQQ